MGTTYDDAVSALYQTPLDDFVAERKRLATELRKNGDKAAAARLVKLGRPTIAAWAVNQLFWQVRPTFDELFAASQRLRTGDRVAAGARREAMAKLRSHAIALLGAAGHPATEATLRRVTTNLSALAAAGGFDPDPPGALAADRAPSGFDIAGLVIPASSSDDGADLQGGEAPPPSVALQVAKTEARPSQESRERELAEAKERKEAAEAQAREERRQREQERQRAEQERRRLAEERARIIAERRRLEAALRVANKDLESRLREVDELRKQLAAAERMLEETRGTVAGVEARLAALEASR
jgi:hypothetical protein